MIKLYYKEQNKRKKIMKIIFKSPLNNGSFKFLVLDNSNKTFQTESSDSTEYSLTDSNLITTVKSKKELDSIASQLLKEGFKSI